MAAWLGLNSSEQPWVGLTGDPLRRHLCMDSKCAAMGNRGLMNCGGPINSTRWEQLPHSRSMPGLRYEDADGGLNLCPQ